MKNRVRINMVISSEVNRLLDDIAEAEGCTKSEVVRRGLSVMRAFQQQRAVGRHHLGFVADPAKLDAEIIGILS